MTRRILFVKLAAIGDVVLSLPALEALRRREPSAEITVLVGRPAAPLLEQNPHTDKIRVIDENIFWRKQLRPLLGLYVELKSQRFDAVYILHWSPWFHRFFWALGVPERFGFDRDGDAFRLTRGVPYVEADADRHDVNQYLHLVSPELPAEGPVTHPPKLYFTASEEQAMNEYLRTRVTQAPVTFAAGGGNNPKLVMPQKRWPADRAAAFVELLARESAAPVFLVGDASEAAILKDVAERYPGRVHSAAGQLSIRETALLIRRSRLFVGNDSGLLHVAGAVGTPSLSFFGPTSPNGKVPTWTRHEVLYRQEPCSPCYRHGRAIACPYQLRCLQDISETDALESVKRLLEGSRA